MELPYECEECWQNDLDDCSPCEHAAAKKWYEEERREDHEVHCDVL